MRFAVLFAVCFPFAAGDFTSVQYEFITSEIVPDVIPVGPPQELHVMFPNGIFISPGQEHIKYYDIRHKPTVEWTCPMQRFNMMCMFDLDEPSYGHNEPNERLLWMVVNVEANYLNEGDVLVEYPDMQFPVLRPGYHRYVILVYEQPWIIEYDMPKIDKMTLEGRDNFSVMYLSTHYRLFNPIAGTFFYTKLV